MDETNLAAVTQRFDEVSAQVTRLTEIVTGNMQAAQAARDSNSSNTVITEDSQGLPVTTMKLKRDEWPSFEGLTKSKDGKTPRCEDVNEKAKTFMWKLERKFTAETLSEEQKWAVVTDLLDGEASSWLRKLAEDHPDISKKSFSEFKSRFMEKYYPELESVPYTDLMEWATTNIKFGDLEAIERKRILTDKLTKEQMAIGNLLVSLPSDVRQRVINDKPESYFGFIYSAKKHMSRSALGSIDTFSVNHFHAKRSKSWKNNGPSKRNRPNNESRNSNNSGLNNNSYKSNYNNNKKNSHYSPHNDEEEERIVTEEDDLEEILKNPVDVPVNLVKTAKDDPDVGTLALVPTLIESEYECESLLDTGSAVNLISMEMCEQFKLDQRVKPSEIPIRARTIKGNVLIIGEVFVKIELALKSQKIDHVVKCYVVDAAMKNLILGVPFIRRFNNEIKLVDLIGDCVDEVTKESSEIEVNMFEYDESEVTKCLRKNSDYYLCFVNQVTSTSTSATLQTERSPTVIDIPVDTPQVNKFKAAIMREFKDVVTDTPPNKLPPKRQYEHQILLIEPNKCTTRRQYPLSYGEKKELTKQVDELLKQGFIRKSMSPFNSPVLFVRKKDNSMRMCVDFRLLNNNTIKDKFPIPHIDELISKFGKAVVYSKLDLMSGYHQVRIKEKDIEKTAFSTDYGHYEWVVMPFGLTNAPSTFQRMMNNVLEEYLDKSVQVYLDDIFIYSRSYKSHYQHVRQVLETLRKNQLIAKASKCAFFYQELRFLGHVITPKGLKTDPEKIRKVKEWPTPKNIKETQMFLGLTTYYRRFVKDHSKIAAPLFDYIAKKSEWGKKQDEAFANLKQALISSPVLIHPSWDSDDTFVVNTDACGKALGYVLEQVDAKGKSKGVVAYGSKKMIGAELNYSIYDREFLAVIEALKTWKYYLQGKRFIIRTDHKSLIYLRNQNLIDSTRVSRWVDYLATFDFDIQYVKGSKNSAADALSRYPYEINFVDVLDVRLEELDQETGDSEVEVNVTTIIETNDSLRKEISASYSKDKNYATVYDVLKNKKTVPQAIRNYIKHFKYANDVLYFKTALDTQFIRIVVPAVKALPQRIIQNAHCGPDSNHPGVWKTYQVLRKSFFWKNMLKSVKKFVNTCYDCQRFNQPTKKLQGLFMPLPIPEGRWTDVTMDFLSGIPKTRNGHDMIMVIIDRFSKLAHFIPCDKHADAVACAKLYVNFCLKHHGVPKRLVSDKDIRFMNRFWYTLHTLMGTSLLFSTTNHPQTDGQTENMNKELLNRLRKRCFNNIMDWDEVLPMVEFSYNSTYHDSIKMSPFELAYGYVPASPKDISAFTIDSNKLSASAEDYIEMMKQVMHSVKDDLVQARKMQEKHHNRKRRFHNYRVGDKILLHRNAFGFDNSKYCKIQPVYFGPFKLVKKIGDNSFEVDLPKHNKKDRVLNIQWFKPFQEPRTLQFKAPTTDNEIRARINEMIGIGGFDTENDTYDVFWKDCDPSQATTVTAEQFNMADENIRRTLFFNAKMLYERGQTQKEDEDEQNGG